MEARAGPMPAAKYSGSAAKIDRRSEGFTMAGFT
jgi:hypothetical protein